jgi:hypothetical protein
MKAKLAAVIVTSLAVFGTIFALAPSTVVAQSSGTGSNTTTSSNMTSGNSTTTNTTSTTPDTMTSGFMGDHMSSMGLEDKGKPFGAISSIQNDEDEDPAWIVTGHWKIVNDTGTTNITDFHAAFQMIRLGGTDEHFHEISNFTQTRNTTTVGNVTRIVGTSTVTMPTGPVNDVVTDIRVNDGKVVTIRLDPEATSDHFGDTPIYGIVVTPELLQQATNMTQTSPAGNSTTGMMGGDRGFSSNQTGTVGPG